MNIGLQMYSIRTVEGNLLQRLEKVKAMGFDGVEFAGFEGYSAKELKAKLDELGLVCVGSHTGYDLFRNDLDQVIEDHKILGAAYINLPGLPLPQGTDEERAEGWKKLAKEFESYAEKINAAGMKFCYHNHYAEFDPIGDTTGEDILFENACPCKVKMELDTCWIEYTGKKSVDFMSKYPKHVGLLHIKELTGYHDGAAKIIGTGAIDFPPIVKLGKELGVPWLIIEHEGLTGDICGDIKAGLDYLRTIS